MKAVLLGILLVWNLMVFMLYSADKTRARKARRRIPEKTLLLCALLGGGVGGFLGMVLLRHKTRHLQFRLLLPAFMLLTAALVVLVAIKVPW